MSASRFIVGVLLGGGLMYAASGDLRREQTVPAETHQASAGRHVPVVQVSKVEAEEIRRKLSEHAAEPEAEKLNLARSEALPPAPSVEELKGRMAKLGLPAAQAKEVIDNLGAVKVNSLLAREEEKRRVASEERARTATSPSADQVSETQDAITSETSVDPYQQLAEQYATNPPYRSEEELIEHRRERFAAYLEAVDHSQHVATQSTESGLPCTGLNCSAAR